MGTLGGFLLGVAVTVGAAAVYHKTKSRNAPQNSVAKQTTPTQTSTQTTSTTNSNKVSGVTEPYYPAETAFVENKDKFVPLLSGVSKNGITNKDKWTEEIVGLNNRELIDMWKAAANNPPLWVTYLQSFGFQTDFVEEFDAVESHTEMYETQNGESVVLGKHYKVVCSCWIYTDEDNNKEVAKKGIVVSSN